MDLRAKTCCFTGHRSLSGEEKMKAAVRLRRVIEEQIKAGIVFYGAGGARGFDTPRLHQTEKALETCSRAFLLLYQLYSHVLRTILRENITADFNIFPRVVRF